MLYLLGCDNAGQILRIKPGFSKAVALPITGAPRSDLLDGPDCDSGDASRAEEGMMEVRDGDALVTTMDSGVE